MCISGRFGNPYIAIACLPTGQSTICHHKNMLCTFTRWLHIVLMVGIGGGISSDGHDTQLGDIMVCRPDGWCWRVLQHCKENIGKNSKLARAGSRKGADDRKYQCSLKVSCIRRNRSTPKTICSILGMAGGPIRAKGWRTTNTLWNHCV